MRVVILASFVVYALFAFIILAQDFLVDFFGFKIYVIFLISYVFSILFFRYNKLIF